MDTSAALTRSVLGWSIRLVSSESRGSSHRFPGYSSQPLGRMLSRSDASTMVQILADYWGQAGEEAIAEYRSYLRRDQRAMTRRTRTEVPGLDLAEHMLERMRSYFVGEERRLLEQGSVMTWKRLEEHWPGRVWFSLKDDYERLARKLYLSEKLFICEIAESIVQVDKIKVVAQ